MNAARLPDSLAHPFSPSGRADPYLAYRWLQEHDPVHYDVTSRMWLLTSHAGCSAALRDSRFSAALGQRTRLRDDALPPSMLTTDHPEHDRLRGPGAILLGPAAVRAAAPGIAAEVERLLDALASRDTVEAVLDIGEPLAAAVLGHVLQIPAPGRTAFARLARRVSVNLDPLAGSSAAAAGRLAMSELHHFLDVHVTGLAGDSPMARLAADERLTRQEMLGILSLCVVGGFEPLADLVGNALFWLLARPLAVAELRDGPDDLGGTAVDELLRIESPIPFTARMTTGPADLADGVLPADARVLAVVAAANRDPRAFERPDELILGRSPNPHLAFGVGPHFCLGAPIVRLAGAILLRGLVRRFPGIRAADGSPTWRPSLVPRRIDALPVHLRPE
jgi:pimeloyl-[acyl-carrier protein] synthase